MTIIERVRKDRGMSQTEAAKRSGLTLGGWHLIEKGKNSPSVKTLKKMAKALEVSIYKLIEEEV